MTQSGPEWLYKAHNTKLETQKKYETVAAAALSIAIARW
jgi:hypothetical protein